MIQKQFILIILTLISLLMILLQGCSTHTKDKTAYASNSSYKFDWDENYIDNNESNQKKIDDGNVDETDDFAQLKIIDNNKVQKWINYFTTKDKNRFQRYLNRGERYKNVVQEILRENGVPEEFYYLAMIESGYHERAYSRAKAVGIWQFMRGTGRKYDLESNYYVDERHDPIRATEAAAKYLRDLYLAFQSWELAMAAYNAGEYRILSSIIKGTSRNYWELANAKLIPRETREYVPKFFAAVIIGQNLKKYGLYINEDNSSEYPNVLAVEVPSPISLKDVSKLTKISLDHLKRVNPHLKRGITPPLSKSYELWIPEKKVKNVKSVIPQLAALSLKAKINYRKLAKSDNKHYHIIRKGENLSQIARRYHVSIAYIKRLNGLYGNRIYAGKKLRVSSKGYRASGYKVKRGDTLIGIAKRFRVNLKSLIKINKLNSSRIYPGMRLKLSSKRSIKI